MNNIFFFDFRSSPLPISFVAVKLIIQSKFQVLVTRISHDFKLADTKHLAEAAITLQPTTELYTANYLLHEYG